MSRLTNVLIFAMGSLLGSVVGASLVFALSKPAQEERKPLKPEPAAADSNPEDAAVRRLTQRVRSLERRVSLLTFAQAHSSPTKEVASAEPGVDREEPPAPKVVDDPVFEAAVRDVVDRVEFERDEQRDTRRIERQQVAGSRWVASLGEKLALTDDQKVQVGSVLSKHFERMRELRNAGAEDRPVLRSEWRQRFQTLQKTAESDLEGVLTPEQSSKYQELERDEKLMGAVPRRGGGRPAPRRD